MSSVPRCHIGRVVCDGFKTADWNWMCVLGYFRGLCVLCGYVQFYISGWKGSFFVKFLITHKQFHFSCLKAITCGCAKVPALHTPFGKKPLTILQVISLHLLSLSSLRSLGSPR